MTLPALRIRVGRARSRVTLAVVVAAAGVCAGCGAGSSPDPSPPAVSRGASPSRAPSTETPAATRTPVAHYDVHLTTRDLADLPVTSPVSHERRLPPRIPGGAPVVATAVGPDGTMAAVETSGRRRLVLVPRHGPPVVVPGTAGAPVRYVDVSRRWVAWTESQSDSYFSDRWWLHVFDRRSGQVRQVARAPQVDRRGYPTVPDGSIPVIDGDHVQIAQAVDVRRGRTVADVIRVPCAGGPAQVVARDAVKPDVVDGRQVVARVGWGFRPYQVYVGGVQVATGTSRLTGLAVADDWVAWSDGAGLWIRHEGGSPQLVLESWAPTYVVAAGDLLVGALEGPSGSQLVALDVTSGDWTRIADRRASGAPWVSGGWLLRDVVEHGRVTGYRLGRVDSG